MTVMRLAAFAGFCYALTGATVITATILGAFLQGQSEVTILLDAFGEHGLEVTIVTIGQWLLPITLYELDNTIRNT